MVSLRRPLHAHGSPRRQERAPSGRYFEQHQFQRRKLRRAYSTSRVRNNKLASLLERIEHPESCRVEGLDHASYIRVNHFCRRSSTGSAWPSQFVAPPPPCGTTRCGPAVTDFVRLYTFLATARRKPNGAALQFCAESSCLVHALFAVFAKAGSPWLYAHAVAVVGIASLEFTPIHHGCDRRNSYAPYCSPDHLVKNRLISSKNRAAAGSCFRKR
jgi:hypothetical protein